MKNYGGARYNLEGGRNISRDGDTPNSPYQIECIL